MGSYRHSGELFFAAIVPSDFVADSWVSSRAKCRYLHKLDYAEGDTITSLCPSSRSKTPTSRIGNARLSAIPAF